MLKIRSPKKFGGFLNLQGLFLVNYVVMDTRNIVLWVLVCVKNMKVRLVFVDHTVQ